MLLVLRRAHLVCQSGCVVGNEMKVCLEEVQVAVVYVLGRRQEKLNSERESGVPCSNF